MCDKYIGESMNWSRFDSLSFDSPIDYRERVKITRQMKKKQDWLTATSIKTIILRNAARGPHRKI
jgi:hypothetical protein